MSNLVPVDDIQFMATAVAKSGLFGIKSPDQAMALMLIAQAEGMHPAIAARDYHIVQGRPALKADAMLARFQQAGGKVEWKVYTDDEVTGVFSHPAGGSVPITWTIEQARRIGLAGKDNWKHYPRAMLRARAISEGIRTVYPGCVVGVYTPEEVQDFDVKPSPVKDMGSVEEVKAKVEEVIEAVEAPSGAYALFMPGAEEAYASYASVEEWTKGYCGLVSRIMSSKKIEAGEKPGKLELLVQANVVVLEGMSGIEKAKWRAAVVEAGGTFSPKPQVSPRTEDSAETF